MEIRRFERTILLLTIFAMIGVSCIGFGVWYIVTRVFEQGATATAVSVMAAILLVSLSFAYRISKAALHPASTLFEALDHVAADPSGVKPPNPHDFSLSQELNRRILLDVYGLVSGQHEAQARIASSSKFSKAILELQSNPILALDRNGIIKYANSQAKEIMPNSIANPLRMLLENAINLEITSGVAFNDWLKDAQADKISDRHVWERVRVTLDDKTIKYFDLVADYNKDESHNIEVVLVLFDKTESYHNDENAFNFVSLAVHELRSPIGVLRGYIEVFEDELGPNLDEDQRDFMAKMSANAAQLATFVNNILNVARIENDQLKVHLQEDNIADVLNSSFDDFEQRASVRRRELQYSIDEHLPSVALDRIGIYEIMSNLIDNAIKYSNEGGLIDVKATKANGGVSVTVTDQGIGIPASSMKNLFERFYRSHHSRDNVAGTGIGLFLSKTLVEAHGGTIWVRSTEGKGTTFGFDLPRYADVKDNLEQPGSNGYLVRSAHGWIKNHGTVRR